jgi:hypothetical protein
MAFTKKVTDAAWMNGLPRKRSTTVKSLRAEIEETSGIL